MSVPALLTFAFMGDAVTPSETSCALVGRDTNLTMKPGSALISTSAQRVQNFAARARVKTQTGLSNASVLRATCSVLMERPVWTCEKRPAL